MGLPSNYLIKNAFMGINISLLRSCAHESLYSLTLVIEIVFKHLWIRGVSKNKVNTVLRNNSKLSIDACVH